MTYICYRGIEVSANFQKALLCIEIVMLLVLSVTALVRVGTGNHPAESLHPTSSWLNPFGLPFGAFATGLILMVFIYWGWDTALSVNEETKDPAKTPGRAAILSTLHPAGHLRAGHLRRAVLRRHRHQGHRPGQPEQRRRRAVGARATRSSATGTFGNVLSPLC